MIDYIFEISNYEFENISLKISKIKKILSGFFKNATLTFEKTHHSYLKKGEIYF
jgi:hypothetical protein